MTTPYICASCRRLTGQYRKSRNFQWTIRAAFVSLNTLQSELRGAPTTETGEKPTAVPRPHLKSRSIPRHAEWPLATNSTDHILESLFLSPRSESSHASHKSRQSPSGAKDGESLDDGSQNASKSTLEELGFKRPERWRKTPITTLKRLRTHHRQPVRQDQYTLPNHFGCLESLLTVSQTKPC